MENVRIGILGLGAISGIYLKNLWLPPLKKEKNSLLWHRKKAFCWEALPIPSWVPLSRPAVN